jgi:hypothetical protein
MYVVHHRLLLGPRLDLTESITIVNLIKIIERSFKNAENLTDFSANRKWPGKNPNVNHRDKDSSSEQKKCAKYREENKARAQNEYSNEQCPHFAVPPFLDQLIISSDLAASLCGQL